MRLCVSFLRTRLLSDMSGTARLAKLGQHPATGLGMQKSDPGFMGAHARTLVNQADTVKLELRQALLEVSNFVGDMMYAGTVLFQEPGNR